jgi:hypothetical protein
MSIIEISVTYKIPLGEVQRAVREGSLVRVEGSGSGTTGQITDDSLTAWLAARNA